MQYNKQQSKLFAALLADHKLAYGKANKKAIKRIHAQVVAFEVRDSAPSKAGLWKYNSLTCAH